MIRFGIVGFGLHAEKRLMPGFVKAERCTVTALSRREIGKAEETAQRHGIPRAFETTEDLCASGGVDAVFIATPDALHLPDTLTAVQHAVPVLCEKPMAMDAGQARQMVARARAAHIPLGVAHVFRFERSVQRFRERVAAGDLGSPVTARAEFFYPGRESPRTWITDPRLACGGPIADVGVHCIDALRFVLADEVVSVHAHAVEDTFSAPLEAAAALTLRFESGTLGGLAVSTRTAYRTFLEVVGEEATLSALDAFSVDHPVTLELRKAGSTGVVAREEVSNADAYALQVDAFAAALEEGGEFDVPGEEGLRNQLVLDAAYRSLERGRTERVARIEAGS